MNKDAKSLVSSTNKFNGFAECGSTEEPTVGSGMLKRCRCRKSRVKGGLKTGNSTNHDKRSHPETPVEARTRSVPRGREEQTRLRKEEAQHCYEGGESLQLAGAKRE
jgi:hypothetical protein